MCGVAGLIARGSETLAPDLLDMLFCVRHRGMDATGVAIYEEPDGAVHLRVTMADPVLMGGLEKIILNHAKILEARSYQGEGVFTFCDARLEMADEAVPALHREIDATAEYCVHSIGRQLRVFKDKGTSADLKKRHQIEPHKGSHGIGHVRLATESAEDINAAHPFISPLSPEMSLVHNGQFTNYFNMRRFLERQGVRFKTRNDSEMAAHYIAWLMAEQNLSLKEALDTALENLDGVFTILVSTPTQVGVVKDRLAIKPMLVFERDGVTVFGSEQISLTPIFEDAFASEMAPGEVAVWSL